MNSYKSIKVLIVEDDFLVSEMIEGVLEDIGYTIVGKAINGRQAVELTQKLSPHLILMDIEMPDMNGIQATELIYTQHPTPIVILTAYETSELVAKASEAGVGAYLVKPPQPREVERAITIAMARFDDIMKLRRLNADLQQALAQVKTLSGLLPICSSCKRIRDDEGNWQQVEVYVHNHTNAQFSHGLCPDCARTLYPDYFGNE